MTAQVPICLAVGWIHQRHAFGVYRAIAHQTGTLETQLGLDLIDFDGVLPAPVAELESLKSGFGDSLHHLREIHVAKKRFHAH